MQGLEGLELIGRKAGVISEEWKDRLAEVRSAIENLKEAPETFKFGPGETPGSDYPDMYEEIFHSMAGYWSGP
jgi:hypothetical protein